METPPTLVRKLTWPNAYVRVSASSAAILELQDLQVAVVQRRAERATVQDAVGNRRPVVGRAATTRLAMGGVRRGRARTWVGRTVHVRWGPQRWLCRGYGVPATP
jgi:hypothetical protein